VTTINNGAVLRRSPLSILNSSGWGRDKKSWTLGLELDEMKKLTELVKFKLATF
jgi:hypothetical protein